jgi:nucleoid-associated protein
MELKNLIIHKLNKDEKVTEKASLDHSEKTLNITNKEILFVQELNNKYSSHSQTYGKFVESEDGNGAGSFPFFLNDQKNYPFQEFSIEASKKLKEIVDSIAPAKGGYVVFAEYYNHNNFLSVFLIRDTKSSVLKKNTSERVYEINDTIHVDTDRLAMACRINIDNYFKDKETYLTFINKRSEDAKFFLKWMSANDTSDSKKDTNTLHAILRRMDIPNDEDNAPQTQADFFSKLHQFIVQKKKTDSYININELSKVFFGDENKIKNFAKELNVPLNEEFRPDATELKRFISIKAKADKITLEFPQEYILDKKVRILESQGQVIIDSIELVNKLLHEYGNS